MTRAVCIGECMIELSATGEGLLARSFAGDAYNTAVYLKRSDPALEVQFATVTGDDPFSAAMRSAWRDEGVGEAFAWTAAGQRPGLYLIETDDLGERRFHYWRGESAARGWLGELLARGGADLLAGADLVYLSGISLAILPPELRDGALDLMRALRGRVGLLAFDPNYRPTLWPADTARCVMDAALRAVDLALPSREDLERLYGCAEPEAQLRLLAERGVAEAAVTTGPGRCLVWADGEVRSVEGTRASVVVDTSGAGDSFNGGYLAARLHGLAPPAAAAAGLALAAQVVRARGAVIARTAEPN